MPSIDRPKGLVLRDVRGTSLIELMVAALVFSFVAASGMKFLVLQHRWAVRQEDSAEAQQQIRTAMDFMGRELGLLGFGLPEGEGKILLAAGQEVEFLANLHAAMARLTEGTPTGLSHLSVRYENGPDQFKGGKTVSICSLDQCERHVLAGDAGSDTLELDQGVTGDFPTGSTVQVINRVRYSLKPMDDANFKLIRTVDGGANPVAEGLSAMELIYLNRKGETTSDINDIHRIQIHMTARAARSPELFRFLEVEVYLRNG